MTITFASATKQNLIQAGQIADNSCRTFIRNALNINKKRVEASRHTVLSGPPGVGKSYGIMEESTRANLKSLLIPPGTTDVIFTTMLALAVFNLKDDEELVVILDDADDVVFGNYENYNKWKTAMNDINYDIGQVPYWSHNKDISNTLIKAEKANNYALIAAIKHFQNPGEIGVNIPTDRCRFVVICNKDCEDPKEFKGKMKSAATAVMDRWNYRRLNLDWDVQWGWLAHVLANSQPFDEYTLSDEQKIKLLDWMYSNWAKLRSTSYRTVRRLAAHMINTPDNYEDHWQSELKGN